MAAQGRGAAQPRSPGLAASVKRLGATLVAILHSRAELISHELERERVYITRLLLLGAAALFFLGLGAITATVFVIVLFWDSQRLVAIGFLTVLYFAIGGGLVAYARSVAGSAKRPFSATVEELRKDRERSTRP